MRTKEKAVFLDRDGTLIKEVNFLSSADGVSLFPNTPRALSVLANRGFRLFVVTNQSGVARGLFDNSAVEQIHARIERELKGSGISIESFHFCPHLPDAGCRCRKPETGMIKDAISGSKIDLSSSWVIGDKELDLELGYNAGCGTSLVRTGYGSAVEPTLRRRPDIIADDILDAALAIKRLDTGV